MGMGMGCKVYEDLQQCAPINPPPPICLFLVGHSKIFLFLGLGPWGLSRDFAVL